MKWSDANAVVENLRRERQLWLPAISSARGFSSSRVEHLLNDLVSAMPDKESYLEVGTMEGRTIQAAAFGNEKKKMIAIDPCKKYKIDPSIPLNVEFFRARWQDIVIPHNIGVVFYDGDHSFEATREFMSEISHKLTDEAVLVLDDWDRETVREGAFAVPEWQLLREMPEYTDGLTCPPNHFGYYFGVALFGYRR